jgi:hypothetical protein
MKYGPYNITRHDSRNIEVNYYEDAFYLEHHIKPEGKKTGDPYVKVTLLGYYQKPEQWLNAIVDDIEMHNVPKMDTFSLQTLLDSVLDTRKMIKDIAKEAKLVEEVWP